MMPEPTQADHDAADAMLGIVRLGRMRDDHNAPAPGAVLRTWEVASDTSAGHYYRVEERVQVKPYDGSTYLYCPCASWKNANNYLGPANCKHAERIRDRIARGESWPMGVKP